MIEKQINDNREEQEQKAATGRLGGEEKCVQENKTKQNMSTPIEPISTQNKTKQKKSSEERRSG